MSTLADLTQLSVQERLQLVQDLWDSIAADSADLALTQEQRTELKWRLDNPSAATYSWEEVAARARESRP